MSASNNSTKKTIYIDIDDEITGIIDKVKSANESIIALVLPKRATVMQSGVNVKLLKRSADQVNKKVVLITSDPNLLPLAGAAGLHVAANLQSRPYVPKTAQEDTKVEDIGEEVAAKEDAEIDPAMPIGQAAGLSKEDQEPIEIDNTPKAPSAPAAAAAKKSAKPPKKDKSKKIPNFQKFRVLLIAGGVALLALIFFIFWAISIAPNAKITLRTESNETQTTVDFLADTSANEVDSDKGLVPASLRELKKAESEKVPATGEKDNGTKAAGQISLRNCTNDSVTIPAGTGVSNNDLTFITQTSVRLDSVMVRRNGVERCESESSTVQIVAQQNGDKYNLTPRDYVVAGFSGITAKGEQMSGGTTKIAKVVSAEDVEAAKKRISDKQNSAVEEVKANLEKDGYIGIVDSFSPGNPNYVVTPAVGAEATEVTVAADVIYSMLGIKENDLKKIVQDKSKDKVDTSKQSILNYGFDDASFEVGRNTRSNTAITVNTTLLVGPEVNQDELKKELAGKKKNEVESMLKDRPGITEVKVNFSPFWVSKVPSKDSKVKFVLEQADGKEITD